ncbi:DUF4394 domain-containing protein [Methylobrevis albus]|uniref:DUF4394 domain-containing protein n=1 Tax=Methylobrevis albus TaxID=2793297 RepID=A0A931N0V5_9HYPH|nr:DUF4394 domain-containing protein [Methylobrevis albus]MBH0239171.1 DUF4394 domain-containing protein [Methylobrevis albus]
MKILAATAAMLLAGAAPAFAANVAALVGDDTIAIVDTEAKRVTGSNFVSGVEGRLLGIDVRPADGMLYGLFEDGTVATIDPMTGAATKVETLKMVPTGAAAVTVDFNPAADALRIMASDGANLRTKITGGAVTEDGRHAFAEGDMHAGETANIIAGAYTNSYAGTESTALYNIDGTIGGLIQQVPPNDGTLKAIGKLDVELGDTVGFDIQSDGQGGNEAWLMSGNTLFSVNLETGAATEAAMIEGVEGNVRDIAVLPQS